MLPRSVAHDSGKLLDRTVHLLAHRMRSKVAPTIVEATMSLGTDLGVQVSGQTIRNALHKAGMKLRKK
jgi:hypothetical protein